MATFAPEVTPAVEEINARFPKLGKGSTYYNHGSDEPGRLPSQYYSADFWSTVKAVHDEAFFWIIENAERLNLELVISWGRIWSAERADEGVRPYVRDANQDGVISSSENHSNHLHVEFNESGYYMPSLSDIRAMVREELKRPDYLALVADTVWKRDIIPSWINVETNPTTQARNAVAEIGRQTKPPPTP